MSEVSLDERRLAASLVERLVERPERFDRVAALTELMAHAAAGLVILEGKQAAAEIAYRIADDTVDCDHIV